MCGLIDVGGRLVSNRKNFSDLRGLLSILTINTLLSLYAKTKSVVCLTSSPVDYLGSVLISQRYLAGVKISARFIMVFVCIPEDVVFLSIIFSSLATTLPVTMKRLLFRFQSFKCHSLRCLVTSSNFIESSMYSNGRLAS